MGVLDLVDAKGVWPLLLFVSAYAAMTRGSDRIEPQDLIRAIYIVDLEHVAVYWDDWQSFESFVVGSEGGYLNRIQYMIRVELVRAKMDGVRELAGMSRIVVEILTAAKKLASDRVGGPATPSSQEILFCACSLDPDLSKSIQKSGMKLDKLTESVEK